MTEPLPFNPDKPLKEGKTDPAEKAIRQRGLLDPADRYRALINAVEASQDLIELADKKARFALVIMSVLNAVAILLVVRGGDTLLPANGPVAILIGIELATYMVITVYYISQAIATLRPRGAPPVSAANLPSVVEPGVSMKMLYYADVTARERAAYRGLWETLRMDNLTAELADQLYTLSIINQQKFAALKRLYFGLTVMTAMLGLVILTVGLYRFG